MITGATPEGAPRGGSGLLKKIFAGFHGWGVKPDRFMLVSHEHFFSKLL
jgi:hypothetical protein